MRQRANRGVPAELHSLKTDGGDDPWHAFPLRDVATQFRVELNGREVDQKGSLSFPQLMREAYPGAIYYYIMRPFRVTRVLTQERKVLVRPERQYYTSPSGPPVFINPRLEEIGYHGGKQLATLCLAECDLYISETITGFTERRGNQQVAMRYPSEYWKRGRFSRNYLSTGVLLAHPALNEPMVQRDILAMLILEAFLLVAPFERSEVACSVGKLGVDRLGLKRGDKFLALYDQTYGSLRLTGRILTVATLQNVLDETAAIAADGRVELPEPLHDATWAALAALRAAAEATEERLELEGVPQTVADDESTIVILPGSTGWILTCDNQDFDVEHIYFSPRDGLMYRGRRPGAASATAFPVANVQAIPGVSMLGRYHMLSGELVPLNTPAE